MKLTSGMPTICARTCRGFLCPTLIITAILLAVAGSVSAQRYHTHNYTEDDGLSSSAVYGITQDTHGRMWFATRFGVSSYDGSHWTTYDLRDGLPNIDQRCILSDPEGRIWSIAGDLATTVFENGVWTALPVLDVTDYEMTPTAALVPRNGGVILMIGTVRDGAWYYSDNLWHRITLPGNPHQRIHDITVLENRVYLASDDGVLRLNPDDPQMTGVYEQAIPRQRTLAVAPDHKTGTLWTVGNNHVGRLRHGLYETVQENLLFELGFNIEYLACEPDRFGGLYVGNPINLQRIDNEGAEQIGLSSGLSGIGATSLFLDREGNMWVGTLRGVTRFSSLRFANYSGEHGLQNDEVTAVIQRGDGDFVLGHPRGFTFFGAEINTITLPPRTASRVLDFALDETGAVWAAVNAFGLARIDPQNRLEWVPIEGASNKDVTSVFADNENRLWVTTISKTYIETNGRLVPRDGGVSLADKNGYLRRIFQTEAGTVYVVSNSGVFRMRRGGYDHILTAGPIRANQVYAFFENPDGEVLLGTNAGLCSLENGKIVKIEHPALRIDRPVYFIVAEGQNNIWFGTDNGVSRWNGTELRQFTIEDGLVGREANRAAGIIDSRGRLWIGMDRGVSVYRPWFDVPSRVPPLVELNNVDIHGSIYPLNEKLELGPEDNTLVFRFDAMSYIDEKKVKFSAWLEGFDDLWLEEFTAPDREIRYTNLSPGDYRFHLRASSAEGVWSSTLSSAAIIIDAPFWRKPQFLLVLFGLLALAVFVGVGFAAQRRHAHRLEFEVRERLDELRMVETELNKAQRIETLGLLAGGIAHDFNNLLTIIIGNLSFISDDPRLEERGQKHAKGALAAATRARSLTRQLLTFSRGGAPLRKPVSIAALIRETISFTMSDANIDYQIELPDDLLIVDIDAGQVSQVIKNLLINAMQAMPDGGNIRIVARNHHTSPRPELKGGRHVEVEITDNGPGIVPENLDRIFDPYFSTREGQTGMGLATSYSIVKRHDGLLTVDSGPEGGTRCRFYVPASDVQTRPVADKKYLVESGLGRILVMDDERAIRNLVGQALKRVGHTVELVSKGEEAVSAYTQRMDEGRKFDVVIMDLTVPGGMGGKETLKLLMKLDPDVRAIVASGYSNDPVIANFKKFGFCGCIRKPFTADDLKQVVAEVLTRPPKR